MAQEKPYTVAVRVETFTEGDEDVNIIEHLAHKVIVTQNGDLLIQLIDEPTPGVGYARGEWKGYMKLPPPATAEELIEEHKKGKKVTSSD